MRSIATLLLVAALGAAPAMAQNTTVVANTVTAENVVAADPANMTATAPANGMTAAPETPRTTDPAAEPPTTGDRGFVTGKREHGFPWGIIGLVGLVGLLGRRRRTD